MSIGHPQAPEDHRLWSRDRKFLTVACGRVSETPAREHVTVMSLRNRMGALPVAIRPSSLNREEFVEELT